MAEAGTTPKAAQKVPHQGDHDRVAMLSLQPDGVPDQHNPEIIGDKEAALRAAQTQFAEQAVSAVDVERTVGLPDPTKVTLVGQEDGSVKAEPLTTGQDPVIAEAVEAHQSAEKVALAAAEKTVEALHKGLGDS